jgi:beta-glucosidase
VRKVNYAHGQLTTLRGFQRIDIAAGKTRQAVINLPCTAFEFFDRASGKMAVTAGEYEIWYGNSSDTKDLKMTKITIQ